jgi:hypothetical protein
MYLSFFLAVGKEAGRWWEIVQEDVGGAGATTSFVDPRSNNQGDKAARLCGAVKMHSKNELMSHPTPRTTHPLHH